MPKLSEEQKTIRKSQAVQVLSLMTTQNLSQVDACHAVGISPQVYRRWIEEEDDAIQVIKDLVLAVEAQELAMITVAQGEILGKLISRALTGGMEDKDLLATVKFLGERSRELQTVVGTDEAEDNALKYLAGPQTRDIRSRSGSRGEATVNVKAKADRSVDITIPVPEDIIDGEFTDDLSGEVESTA